MFHDKRIDDENIVKSYNHRPRKFLELVVDGKTSVLVTKCMYSENRDENKSRN